MLRIVGYALGLVALAILVNLLLGLASVLVSWKTVSAVLGVLLILLLVRFVFRYKII